MLYTNGTVSYVNWVGHTRLFESSRSAGSSEIALLPASHQGLRRYDFIFGDASDYSLATQIKVTGVRPARPNPKK